jgi:hypothetical protein
MKPVREIILSNSGIEAHMMGDSVAVCWNVHRVEKKITGEDGETYRALVWERTKPEDPFIDFVRVRGSGDEDDPYYEDEDSPVEGGLPLEKAKKIYEELGKAIEYHKVTVKQALCYIGKKTQKR